MNANTNVNNASNNTNNNNNNMLVKQTARQWTL